MGSNLPMQWGLLSFRDSRYPNLQDPHESILQLLEKCLGVEKVTHVLPIPDLFYSNSFHVSDCSWFLATFLEGCGILVPEPGMEPVLLQCKH